MRLHGTLLGILWLVLSAGAVSWSQGPQGLPDPLLKEVRAPEELPKATYTLVRAWGAETGGHTSGRLVDDPDAEGGKAWEVKPGADKAGTVLFGPYIEIEPGSYVAFFRVKLLETPEDDLPGQLDACVGYAQNMLATRDLAPDDLVIGKYAQVPLGFRYTQGKLECRVTWPGAVGLRIDRVSLFRVEGVDPTKLGWQVPEAVPSGLPKDLAYRAEPKPFPELFPRSAPPAKDLMVCDLRQERADVRMLVYSLQGLVNRKQPVLYCTSVETDPFWLEQMRQRGWVERTETVAQPLQLLERFRDRFQGVVVTDPNLPATKNVATMIASVKDVLVVSPRLAKQLALPVVDDLRGRWKTSAEAYRWAFDNLWGSLNHHVIACSWPDHLALRDYLVENKVFIFWISGTLDGARKYASPNDELRLMEELLAKMPINIPVMSYPWAGVGVGIGEGPGVTLFAEFGKYLVGSIDCANLSVHSGIVVPELKQKPAPPPPKLEAGKVYVTLVMSDGDNLPVLTSGNFPQLWADKLRGQFPIGWTLSPSASMLIPDVVDYYYRTATPNDDFLGAVSGIGYTYPDSYAKRYREADRRRIYDEFLDQTATYMKRSDEQDLWIMNATRPEVISRYAERIKFLDALFPDYGRRVVSGDAATYPTARNVPVFHAVTGWQQEATREERITNMVSDVRRMTPAQRPAFLHFFVLNWFADLPLLQEALKQLGPDYVAVRPDHLAALWRQEMKQREVVAQLPSSAATIENQPLKLEGTVRNVADRALDVEVRLRQGLEGAAVTPGKVRLEPAQQVPLVVTGRPAGDTLVLEMAGAFGVRRAEVALHRIAAAEVVGTLPPAAGLIPTTFMEAESLAHNFGALQADPDASGGDTWLAKRGETHAGHILFGPYLPLDAGRYLALVRLKRVGEGEGVVARLDACVAGGSPETGHQDVRAEDLPLNQFRWVPMVFEHPGGNFETRVFWTGAASLAVDSVALWRLEGR